VLDGTRLKTATTVARRFRSKSGRWLAIGLVGALALAACNARATDSASIESMIIRGEALHAPESSHPSVLRIADWNIKAGRDSSFTAISEKLAVLDADVITLQEVDMKTHRTGDIDQPSVLGRALGYNYAFAPTIPWDGGYYGIATFSRYPFTSIGRIHLSNGHASEPRTALEALVCVDTTCFRAVNHHADVVRLAAELSTTEVLQHVHAELGTGLALVGDFNQAPSDPGPQACLKAGLIDLGAELGPAATFGAERIDYAFADAVLVPCAQRVEVEPGAESDHNALVVDFDISCVSARH
jgi:endonuclease/exonuclease/phosphatase family metal-dependent hydrolase